MAATAIPDWVWDAHTITLAPHLGVNAHGHLYGPSVDLRCVVDDTAKLVRLPTGQEIMSSTQVFLPPGTTVPLGSRVTLPAPWSRTATVVAVLDRYGGGLPTPDHVHISLE